MGQKSVMEKKTSATDGTTPAPVFDAKQPSPYAHLRWKYFLVYRALCTTKGVFFGRKEPVRESNTFAEQAESLLANIETSDVATLDKGKELIKLQRLVEDTRARRRLERWACKIIAIYLAFVFVLILLNGASQMIYEDIFKEHGFISDTVMTVILSTTTVNIIGLGVIILRGHFDTHKDKDTPVPTQKSGQTADAGE